MEEKLYDVVVRNHSIETYGYDVTEVTKYLPDVVADNFAKASEDLDNEENRAYIQACYYVCMQMKSVTSTGKMDLNEGTIKDTARLILLGEL